MLRLRKEASTARLSASAYALYTTASMSESMTQLMLKYVKAHRPPRMRVCEYAGSCCAGTPALVEATIML